jgi:multiple sugar transport system substrate-binding protein
VTKNTTAPYEAYKFIRFYSDQGMKIKGAGFSGTRANPAKDFTLEVMSGKNESGLYHMDSLRAVFLNPDWFDNDWPFSPSVVSEIGGLRHETANEYMTGGLSLDDAMKKFDTEGRKAFERWKQDR